MFIEETIAGCWDFGSGVGEPYAVDIVVTQNGSEYRSLRHPYPRIVIDLGFNNRTEDYMFDNIMDIYRRSGGQFGGFRWRHPSDYSTLNRNEAPTFSDQLCVLVSTGIYQITNWYGTEGAATALRRKIFKPVTGTTLVGISNPITGAIQSINGWSVDTTNGQVTFTSNQKTITAITKASQAVITVGTSHGYVVNNTVYVSGVAGMTEMNGRRGLITAISGTTITVNINSTAFTTYTSGGQTNASPQAGETVRAGCLFDIPVRFNNDISDLSYLTRNPSDLIMGTDVSLVELLNP